MEAGREPPLWVNAYIEITGRNALCPGAERGDGDPLDICVISERPIQRSEIIVPARVVGGLQLLYRGEADDKVIAVLEADSSGAR